MEPTLDKSNLLVFKFATYTLTSALQFAEVRLPWSVIYMVARSRAMGQMLAEHQFIYKVSQYHGYDDKSNKSNGAIIDIHYSTTGSTDQLGRKFPGVAWLDYRFYVSCLLLSCSAFRIGCRGPALQFPGKECDVNVMSHSCDKELLAGQTVTRSLTLITRSGVLTLTLLLPLMCTQLNRWRSTSYIRHNFRW